MTELKKKQDELAAELEQLKEIEKVLPAWCEGEQP